MAETDQDDLISIIEDSDQETELPPVLPLMPVRDVVVFTDMLLPLFVGRERSIQAVEEAISGESLIFLATQKEASVEKPKAEDIYRVGTVARVLRILKLPDGRIKTLVQGITKAKIVRYVRKRPFFRVKFEVLEEPDIGDIDVEIEALMRTARENSEKILALRGELTGDIGSILESIEEPGRLADLVASNLRLKTDESQELLELIDSLQRLRKVNDLLYRELELSSMQAKIQSDVRDEISKSQRDFFLREQVRAIHRELGEGDEKAQEIEDYRGSIKKARMPEPARDEAHKQLRRLEQMHPESAESSVVRTYLDWLVELPWRRSSRERIDINRSKSILDRDHYGLNDVKDRILEYLSVRKLNPKMKGPILCFVGPPGVGKTSLGQSIARAMNRKFVRISLGGVRDEAEIRGHRRTYVGALPGRIIQGLKQGGTNNPVFMMDEIDKLGSDFRGDPSSALLEALDPEQNAAFSDHYLNLAFDLSNVMFILTANIVDTIPSALLDRMEVIHLSGYTLEEKRMIAREHLIPRQIKENGLKSRKIHISDGALQQIIVEYTQEAGLRNLERVLGRLCRKIARRIAEGEKGRFGVTRNNLVKYLGVAPYYPEMDQEETQIGLTTGLAWTQSGGEVLYVETALIDGKGELILTGQIGDVMQESARAAMTYVRSRFNVWGIPKGRLDQLDVHIHVPAGAIPKDGPSAGVAIATALISVLTDTPVHKDVAMTGEITIRGRVLPIGGLKEKALGAIRGGIKTVLIPEKNTRELSELPANVRRKLRFVTIRQLDDVLPLAFDGRVGKTAKRGAGKKSAGKRTSGKKSAEKRGA